MSGVWLSGNPKYGHPGGLPRSSSPKAGNGASAPGNREILQGFSRSTCCAQGLKEWPPVSAGGRRGLQSHTLVMVPTALVRPSRNTSRWSMCRYSGVLMKRKCTVALSPVRRQSLSILRMVAVCLMLPQCTAKGARGQDRVGPPTGLNRGSESKHKMCLSCGRLQTSGRPSELDAALRSDPAPHSPTFSTS